MPAAQCHSDEASYKDSGRAEPRFWQGGDGPAGRVLANFHEFCFVISDDRLYKDEGKMAASVCLASAKKLAPIVHIYMVYV